MEIKRRNFIKTLSFASGGLLILPACSGLVPRWRFFTQEEAETVIAVAEQIIPSDMDAGATEAGVINYIDLQLAGFYSNYQETYRKGISALKQFCVEKHSNIFEKLEWEIQTDVLKLMEKDSIEGDYWKKNSSSRFFRLLRDHTMQGFYGSPRHGGNKYYASYKMIGIEYPHIIGQNRYSPLSKTLNTYKK